jgi:hypothetical protein
MHLNVLGMPKWYLEGIRERTMEEEADIVDLLLQLAIFATFVGFGVALWVVKRDRREKAGKELQDGDERPPAEPGQ